MLCMNVAIVFYDYKVIDSEEFFIKKDERLVVLDDSKGWWKVENFRYEKGYVFFNYVKKIKFIGKSWLKGKSIKLLKENGVMLLFGEYFVF